MTSGVRLFGFLALLLCTNSCAEYQFKNQTWWGSLQQGGAAQFRTLDDSFSKLSMQQFIALWNDPKQQLICTNASTEQDLYTGLRTLCSNHPGSCSIQVVQQLAKFNAKAKNPRKHLVDAGLTAAEVDDGMAEIYPGIIEGGEGVAVSPDADSTCVAPRSIDAPAESFPEEAK